MPESEEQLRVLVAGPRECGFDELDFEIGAKLRGAINARDVPQILGGSVVTAPGMTGGGVR